MTELICVGAVAGAFGVRGEVRLKSFTAHPESIADYGPLTTEDGKTTFNVTINRRVKGGLAARLSGVATREQAEALRGTRLYAPRSVLPKLPDDEFYHADLIGLSVFDTGGRELGRIKSVQNHGAGDLLEIETPARKTTFLLPFAKDVVPTVDLSAGRIVADPPPGILPE